jgi:hypothetical protein
MLNLHSFLYYKQYITLTITLNNFIYGKLSLIISVFTGENRCFIKVVDRNLRGFEL